jgi:hypothetical protein
VGWLVLLSNLHMPTLPLLPELAFPLTLSSRYDLGEDVKKVFYYMFFWKGNGESDSASYREKAKIELF